MITLENKTSVSIIGTYALRDVLALNSDSGYTVDRSVQAVNPVSAVQTEKVCGEGMDIIKSEAYKTGTLAKYPNAAKRNFWLDLNKQVFDYLFAGRSDYLIMDVGCLGFPIMRFMSNGKEKLLTGFSKSKLITDELIDQGYISADECSIIKSEEELFPLIEKYLPVYINKILEHYPVEKIILVEIYPARFYIEKYKKTMSLFNDENYYNYAGIIRFGYKIAKKLLHGCHIVEFPDYVVADENNLRGLDCMNYCRKYYDYVYKAFGMIINENKGRLAEELKLKRLKDECSRIFSSSYEHLLSNEMINLKRMALIAAKYADYFKALLTDPDKINNILNYFKVNDFHGCCLYGYNRVAQMFIELFKKNGISVDYIIDSTTHKFVGGIPVLPRDTKRYPETDVIIICNVDDPNIERSVGSETDIPVISLYGIIK